MRFLVVDTYYPGFTADLYASRPHLTSAPYAEQLRELMDQHFGTADYYSTNLHQQGHEAQDVVANLEPLQRQWAAEHGVRIHDSVWRIKRGAGAVPWPRRVPSTAWLAEVLRAQVRQYRPDVLHVHDMNGIAAPLLRELKPYVGVITGQIASEVAPGADFGVYDLVLSSFPHFVERFRRQGLRSEYFQLGFEPRILDAVGKPRTRHDLVFIGGLSAKHASRIEFLEGLARRQRIDWWGYGVELLGRESPLRSSYHGPAWGIEMYRRLSEARVALNFHVDTAADYANNMRLYEATGVGAMLLTDRKRNLDDILEVGREVVAYDSPEECAELARHYLDAEGERAAIARAGQERTLSSHTYGHRMAQLVELVRPLLPQRRETVGALSSRAEAAG